MPSTSQPIENKTQAFSRAYRLFGELMLYGAREDTLIYIRAVPELAEALPEATFDELAADHYQVLGFEIHPFESAFLEPEGLVGGAVTESVFSAYREAGFAPHTDSESADHIGWELHFLAYLCDLQTRLDLESRALETARSRADQLRFLEGHLLRWLPALVETVRRQGKPFYTILGELTLALAISHYDELARFSLETPAPFRLPDPPDLLADEGTGLRDIAGYLLTPVYAGVYFSPADIRRLARRQNLPRGFGDRRHMLTSLLRNAAEYDQMPVLVEALRLQFETCASAYRALSNSPGMSESLGPFIRPWRERAQHALSLLGEIARLARDYPAGES